jgi:transcriptional regulator with XRE-family HTH domain
VTTGAKTLRRKWGAEVRERRLALSLSQAALGAAVGVTQQTVAEWEAGTSAPRDELRAAVARALGTTAANLFTWEEVA